MIIQALSENSQEDFFLIGKGNREDGASIQVRTGTAAVVRGDGIEVRGAEALLKLSQKGRDLTITFRREGFRGGAEFASNVHSNVDYSAAHEGIYAQGVTRFEAKPAFTLVWQVTHDDLVNLTER